MKLLADSNGSLLGLWADWMISGLAYVDDGGAQHVAVTALWVCERTNASLVADVAAERSRYTLQNPANPTLYKDGVAVAVAGSGSLVNVDTTVFNSISDQVVKASVLALWNGTATNAQAQRAIAYLAVQLHRAGLLVSR